MLLWKRKAKVGKDATAAKNLTLYGVGYGPIISGASYEEVIRVDENFNLETDLKTHASTAVYTNPDVRRLENISREISRSYNYQGFIPIYDTPYDIPAICYYDKEPSNAELVWLLKILSISRIYGFILIIKEPLNVKTSWVAESSLNYIVHDVA
jgi:hypothetical protein